MVTRSDGGDTGSVKEVFSMKKITVPEILKMKAEGRKIPALTAYGFSIASILDEAGIPLFIVGDSAGMVEAGYATTIPVTMDEMIYHTRCVARGTKTALIVSDMPFGSYQSSIDDARRNALRLVKEGGAEAVKLEGGVRVAAVIKAISEMDVPVMGHIGLTPQSFHRMGGFKVQGKTKNDAETILDDAYAVAEAGAFAIVLEGIPSELAREITASVSIPTIGIGAGPFCDGQVLVINDMIGLNTVKTPKFVKKYADTRAVIDAAVRRYIEEVEEGVFPSKNESY